MKANIEFVTYLPSKYKTWTKFYEDLIEQGEEKKDIVHYVSTGTVKGATGAGSTNAAYEEAYYQMKYIKQQVEKEKNIDSK